MLMRMRPVLILPLILASTISSGEVPITQDYELLVSAPIIYPELAFARGIETVIYIEFDIDKSGRTKNVQVLESEHSD